MCGLEEFETAIFDEGNIAPAELDLEEVAVMRGAEQHRLPAQRGAGLAVVEHAVGDIPSLRCLVLDIGQERQLCRSLGRIEGLRDLLGGPGNHRVRGIEDRLGRAIIALERDDRGRWRETVGKVEDVAHGCRAERIDRLRVVADDGSPDPSGRSASRISAWSRLVSWYSSTRTWSKQPRISVATTGSAIAWRQYSKRSS